jgi:hypothetical protein
VISLPMYRIIQWATGNVGHHALRMIVDRPDFEPVGLRVYDPAKRGKDAGDLLGTGPVGVKATDDPAQILALDADCACYTNLEGGGVNAYQRISDACAAGKTSFFHAGIDPEFELIDHLSDRSDSCRKTL